MEGNLQVNRRVAGSEQAAMLSRGLQSPAGHTVPEEALVPVQPLSEKGDGLMGVDLILQT